MSLSAASAAVPSTQSVPAVEGEAGAQPAQVRPLVALPQQSGLAHASVTYSQQAVPAVTASQTLHATT